MRLLFKAYFPAQSFSHLHQTSEQLLLKVFATENYLNKITKLLYLDQTVANDALQHKIGRLLERLKEENYDNFPIVQSARVALLFADAKALEKVPYFLR
jgi:hypothetical protein